MAILNVEAVNRKLFGPIVIVFLIIRLDCSFDHLSVV